jgi:MFS family permease
MTEAVQLEAHARAGTRRLFWRNYLAHSLEGGLFMGALSFVSASTLLPTVVRSLRGPDWLISMMPVMMAVGALLPPVFTAHVIDRLRRYMPLLLVTGVFQRVPYLLAGLALLQPCRQPRRGAGGGGPGAAGLRPLLRRELHRLAAVGDPHGSRPAAGGSATSPPCRCCACWPRWAS